MNDLGPQFMKISPVNKKEVKLSKFDISDAQKFETSKEPNEFAFDIQKYAAAIKTAFSNG